MSWAQKHAAAWELFLLNRGYSAEDAKRLGGFFGAQDALETGDGTNRGARELNNFGGMRTANGYKKYNSTEAYMADKLSMMQRKFGDALNAQSIDEFAQILGDPTRAGKHQLYYVTDKVKYNPNNLAWIDAQTRHMYNYINGMRSKAGMESMSRAAARHRAEHPEMYDMSYSYIAADPTKIGPVARPIAIPKKRVISQSQDPVYSYELPEVVVTGHKPKLTLPDIQESQKDVVGKWFSKVSGLNLDDLMWELYAPTYKPLLIPHYAGGEDGDNTRVVNPREERFRIGLLITDEMRIAENLARNYSEVKPAPQISQAERDINRDRAETKQWNENKKAVELATDLMMIGMLDPRYATLGFGIGLIARAASSVINAGKNLYKGYKVSRAIDKAVKGGIMNPPTIGNSTTKILADEAGHTSDLNFMFQSTIDHYKNGGLSSLVDGDLYSSDFKNFVGLSPEEFKSHWTNKLRGRVPDSSVERFLSRELDVELKRAQETLDDIKSALNIGYYQLDDRLKPALNRMVDLFDSKEYRSRWPAYSSRPDDLIKNIEKVSGSVQKRHIVDGVTSPLFIPKKVNAAGVYSPSTHNILVLERNLERFTPEHEFSHASDLGEDIEDLIYDKMVPKKSTGVDFDYYNLRTEKRARVMAALSDMRERGYNINDYNGIQDYLLFENGFGNHSVESIFKNYDFKIPDLLDIFRYGKGIIPPIITIGAFANKFNNND